MITGKNNHNLKGENKDFAELFLLKKCYDVILVW